MLRPIAVASVLAGSLVAVVGCGPAAPSATAPAAGAPAASAPAPSAARVAYFRGKSATSSPDGATPYGPPADVVVRRTVDPGAGTIVELVVSAGREIPTTLKRASGGTFDASDDKRSFAGTIAFTGAEWSWDAWTYAIKMSDGSGEITGKGKLEGGTLTTEKTFARDGKPMVRITDQLAPSTAEEFERERTRLLALPAPTRR